jgi:mRNA interferase MazF
MEQDKETGIWWCYLGANIGNEQDGKGAEFMRPVLIYKKLSRSLCLAMPLSTKVASGSFFFPLLSRSNIIRTAILPQMKPLDVKRLIKKIDKISPEEYVFIKERVTAFIQ